MDPLKQQQLTLPVVEVYLAIEEQILINIARQLRKHKSLLTEDNILSWQTEQTNMLENLTQQNIVTIAKKSGLAIDEVTKMLKKAGFSTVKEYEGDLQEAVQEGMLVAPPAIEESSALQDVLATFQAQAVNTFNLVNTTLIQQAYQAKLDIINQTVGKVLAGVQTPQEALREVARQWANDGVPALIDKAGRKWSTEAYVNMIMRSTSNRIANEMQDTRMDEYGADLIEVSSHMGARPKCSPYQGRVFSRSGKDPKYSAFSTTSYGQPDGLFGINCRHVKYPFIPGITKQRYEPYNEKENQKAYEESQQHRYLERQIRKAKRELAMMMEMKDPYGVNDAEEEVKEAQANMREFISATGRTRRYNREKPY
jgi:Phage minor capsid protein 2